jgi:hypothetical protein
MITTTIKDLVITQLGECAWENIAKGDPVVSGGYLYFWLRGQECAWGIDTDPVLLIQLETDKEFLTFHDLLEEIRGEPQGQSPALSRHNRA